MYIVQLFKSGLVSKGNLIMVKSGNKLLGMGTQKTLPKHLLSKLVNGCKIQPLQHPLQPTVIYNQIVVNV